MCTCQQMHQVVSNSSGQLGSLNSDCKYPQCTTLLLTHVSNMLCRPCLCHAVLHAALLCLAQLLPWLLLQVF